REAEGFEYVDRILRPLRSFAAAISLLLCRFVSFCQCGIGPVVLVQVPAFSSSFFHPQQSLSDRRREVLCHTVFPLSKDFPNDLEFLPSPRSRLLQRI
ncbi:hypothetical protein CSUI_009844, partial [Cystoisospora suis]